MKISMIVAVAALMSAVTVCASTPLKKDPAVRTGQLSNGMTYFIRHNEQTPGQADFYIAQKAGSILEEPDQRGLAHFLEHMAFNGSAHFPDGNAGSRGIRNWCERNGIKFGADLNAYTSIEQTVYNISNAPVSKEGVIDTCLIILTDWSNRLLLKDEEIDQERGVIREEWRSRRSSKASQRMMEDVMPVIYRGTKYADCLPIGHIEVVDTFKYEALRSFYRKWYRPDLQALIVVGDVDVDEVEKKIRHWAGDIVMPENPAERRYYSIPDNDRMIVFSKTDDEQPTVNLSLYQKRDATPRSERASREAFADGFKSRLAMFILRQRLSELTKEATPRLMSASVRDGSFYVTKEKEAFSLNMGLLPDKLREGIDAAIEVVEKARRYGFTEAELEHAKIQHALSTAHKLETKEKTRNSEFAGQIVSHFCGAEPLLSIDDEYELQTTLEEQVTLDDVNAVIKDIVTDRNQVVVMYGPTKWNGTAYQLPDTLEVEKWILEAQQRDYVNDIKNTPIDRTFIKKLPKKGKILEKKASTNGFIHYSLSNGINAYVRPTDIEPNRITVKMFRAGGRSLYGDEDVPSMAFLTNVVTNSGAADFDKLMLEKKRAGKALKVTPFFDSEEEGFQGVGAASDLKTWLEVMYLYATQPRRDEAIFSNIMNKQRSLLKNRNANPNVTFNDSLRAAVYGHGERTVPMTLERLDKVSLDRIYEIYHERFDNMAGMNLIICGDVRMDDIENLLCQYVASLPGKKVKKGEVVKTEAGSNILDIRRVADTCVFSEKMATPSALTTVVYAADMPYTAMTDLKADVLAQIMRAVYTEKVREEKGGTYGVSVKSQCWTLPKEGFSLTVNFRCDPEKYDELLPIIDEQLKLMAQNGPTEEQVAKIKEYELKNYERNIRSNGWWEYVKYHELSEGIDFDSTYTDDVKSLTPAMIRDFCRALIDSGTRIQVTMRNEKMKK